MNLAKKLLNHPLFSGSAIVFAGNMTANIINYAYHLVMGRLLGPVEYGVLASLYSILYLVSIIPSSASVSIVKFASTAKEGDLFSVYTLFNRFVFKLAIVLSLITVIISPTISKFLHIDNQLLVVLVAPILFFLLITLVNQSMSQGMLKFAGLIVPTIISASLKFLIGVLFVFIGWSVFGALVGVVIGVAAAYIYSQKFILKILPKTRIKEISLNPFLKFTGPVLIQALAFTSIFTTDVLLAKHFLNPFDAGLYAALSTLGKIIFFAASPVASAMFPVVAKRKSLNQSYIKVFAASLIVTFFIAGSATLIFWLFPNITIGLLYGAKYLSANGDLIWMGIFMLFYTLSNLLVNFYLSIGKTKVIYIPLITAIIQAVIIWFNHNSIAQIIHISWITSALMFLCLAGFTGYNLLNEKK